MVQEKDIIRTYCSDRQKDDNLLREEILLLGRFTRFAMEAPGAFQFSLVPMLFNSGICYCL